MKNADRKKLLMLGCTHHKTGLEIRERFSITAEQQNALHKDFSKITTIIEYVILNTCNRLEIYIVGEQTFKEHKISEILCARIGIGIALFEQHKVRLEGEAVLKHLFEVASGVDSQIVGEAEILGQVKDSYEEAKGRGTTGMVLNRIFQKGFQAAKWTRTNTGIGKGQVSIGNIATELAMRIFGDISKVPVLIIGSGTIAEQTLKAFKSRSGRHLTVTNHNPQKAQTLAAKYGTASLQYEFLYAMLHCFDIVVTSTTANKVILDRPVVEKTLKQRENSPLFFIDLAVPRNIAHSIAHCHNTYLYNLDDLAIIANKNMEGRRASIAKCYSYLEQKAMQVWNKVNVAR